MVLLVTIGLVIISAVTLVVGFIQDSVGWIYASIGCSIAAAVILIISARTGRAAPVGSVGGPSTLDYSAEETIVGDASFPISDYDELLVTEIIPLLAALDAVELEQVRAREQAGKARTSVLRRIDAELDERASAPAVGPVTEAMLVEEEPSLADALVTSDNGGAGLEFDDEPFPIEDYDDLRVGEVLPLLPQLYADELDLVAARERAGAGRAAVLDRIAELLEGDEATMAIDVVDDVPAGSAPAKKSAAKKSATKTAAPLKKSAKQQSARTLTPSKAAKKAAPVKKAATKKAAPAKKAPAKKAATKQAAPAKKAAAKKSG